jgi:hypothetical protein
MRICAATFALFTLSTWTFAADSPLRPVLTEAQLKKLEALRDERHDPGHRHCEIDQK